MRSIATFLLMIFIVNIGSTMALTFEALTQDKDAIEYVVVNTLEEDMSSDVHEHLCCSTDDKTDTQQEDKGCCTDDCDCSCCHHVTITTSSQIISNIHKIEFHNTILFFLKNEFSYEYLYGNDANASIFQPPKNS